MSGYESDECFVGDGSGEGAGEEGGRVLCEDEEVVVARGDEGCGCGSEEMMRER